MGFWQDIIDVFRGVKHSAAPDGADPALGAQDVAKVIMAHNHPFVNVAGGAEIHQITQDQALSLAALIMDEAEKSGINLCYAMSCISQESAFDPACYNKNLSHDNPTATFEGTDWGLCQFNGLWLPDKFPNQKLTNDEMQAKALDPTWAVPTFFATMASLLRWGNNMLAAHPELAKVAENKYFLATLAYNAGQTEAIKEVRSDVVRQHPHSVEKICAEIASELGVKNPMA